MLALKEYVPLGFIHIAGQPTPVWAETPNGDLIVGRTLEELYTVRKAQVSMSFKPAHLPQGP